MPSTAPCQRCAAPMPPAATGDLCPSCLARLAQAAWLDPVSLRHPEPRPERRDLPTTSPTPVRNRFLGDYELLEEIARGGMGIVFKARQISLNRVVAVKMIRAGVLASELDIARFQAEAKAAACLQHPNIIAIHEVGEHDDHHYFSMDYVEGRNLSACVREHPWSAPRAARCLERVASTVHYAHQHGILHRDLKPSNVILDASDTPHLTDFGLATRIEEASALTLSGSILGTPSYMAPEQTGGRAVEIGPATDVYALGAILYEVLTGRPPFQGETPLETIKLVRDTDPVSPRRLNPNIPGDLETICLKCLEKEPRRRYGTASELAQDLGRFLRHEPIQARPVMAWEHGLKWVRRNPWRAALVGACAVAVVTALGLAFQISTNQKLSDALKVSEEANARANHERQRAEGEKKIADAALAEIERAQDTAIRSDYLRRITEAHQALEANSVAEAENLLENCPEHLRRWEWNYLKRQTRSELAIRQLATNGVRHITMSMDGTQAATVDMTGWIHLLDLATGEVQSLGQASLRAVSAIALAHQAPWLAIGGDEVTKANSLGQPSPYSRTVVTIPALEQRPRALALGANDELLLSVDHQGLTAWDLARGTGHWCAPAPPHGTGLGLAVSLDGNSIAWITGPPGQEDEKGSYPEYRGDAVHVFNILHGSAHRMRQHLISDVCAVAISRCSRKLATGHGDGRIRFWNSTSGHPEEFLRAHAGPVTALAFDRDDHRLVSGGADRTVRVWTPGNSASSSVFLGHRSDIVGVAFSPDGRQIVAASLDGWVRTWDSEAPQACRQTQAKGGSIGFLNNELIGTSDGAVYSVQTAKETQRIGTGSNYGRVKGYNGSEWCVINAQPIRLQAGSLVVPNSGSWTWSPARTRIECAAVDPSGAVIAAASGARKLAIGKLDDGSLLRVIDLSTHGSPSLWAYDLAFSPNGRFLAATTGAWDPSAHRGGFQPGEVQIWDWNAGGLVHRLVARQFAVWTTAFTPDGTRMISAGGLAITPQLNSGYSPPHGEVQVWDLSTGCELFCLPGVPDNVFGIAVSPDGTRVAAAIGKHQSKTPGLVKLWDLETGAEVLTLRGFSGPVHGVAFSPDGKRLAAIGSGTLRIWSVE